MDDHDRPDVPLPACIIDGVTDSAELTFHTIGGVRIALCRCCYRRLLESVGDIPAPIWEPPDQLERIGQALIAEADLLAMLAIERRQFGRMLIDRVRRAAPFDASDSDDDPRAQSLTKK